MPTTARPKITANVKKALGVLAGDPKLTRELHEVLARLYEKAGVKLTQAEKAALLAEVGASIGQRKYGTTHPA